VNGINDPVTNGYRCVSGGANNDTLRLDWTTGAMSSGSAKQYDGTDAQWWWQPTVNVTDDRPTVETRTGGGNWQQVAVNADADPNPGTPQNENDVRTQALYTWGQDPNVPNGVVPLPNANNTMGRFLGQATLPHAVGTEARATVRLHITVSGTGDNITVDKWKVGIMANFTTTAQ
jgi:hypothetical protein